MTNLSDLAVPFPDTYIRKNPSGGGHYVTHSVIVQRLLMAVGPYSFAIVELLRGHVDAVAPNPSGKSAKAKTGSPALENAVVGALCRLSVTVDGTPVEITEVGDCESPHNWPHDGARAKDASSDALKRCAMRLGLGLHLWAQGDYFLDRALNTDTDAPAMTRSPEAEVDSAIDSGPPGEEAGKPQRFAKVTPAGGETRLASEKQIYMLRAKLKKKGYPDSIPDGWLSAGLPDFLGAFPALKVNDALAFIEALEPA